MSCSKMALQHGMMNAETFHSLNLSMHLRYLPEVFSRKRENRCVRMTHRLPVPTVISSTTSKDACAIICKTCLSDEPLMPDPGLLPSIAREPRSVGVVVVVIA